MNYFVPDSSAIIFMKLRTLSDEVGDVNLCKDHLGNEYLQMNERNTKTRTRTDVKNKREIPQRAWPNVNNQSRCPVEAYKLYKSKRPPNFCKADDPFYIQENTNPNKYKGLHPPPHLIVF
jgi:hypothetical protein